VRNTTQRLTSGPDSENSPVWFPDGNKVAYRKDQGGMFEIDTTGSGVERMLLADNVNGPDQVSADGKWIVYFAVTSAGNQQDVYVLPTGAGGKPQAVVQTPFADVEPQLSPNGRWLAYASNDNGQHEVYVQPFPSSGRRWRVSNTGGRQPLWRADGKELFYVTEEAKLYAVPVGPSADVFEFGTPKFLFVLPANVFQVRNSYIPNRQASRFLVNMIIKGDDAPIHVVHNWRAAVK
jgi:Tol biopolymer transport system component